MHAPIMAVYCTIWHFTTRINKNRRLIVFLSSETCTPSDEHRTVNIVRNGSRYPTTVSLPLKTNTAIQI